MIKSLKQDDGMWVDPEGCSWDSPVNYLCIGVLPSCGCGDPESIGRYVQHMLKAHVAIASEDYSPWDNNSYEDLPVMFFLSWADREGYIEHGSSIRCSWLTDKGREILADLDSVFPTDGGKEAGGA